MSSPAPSQHPRQRERDRRRTVVMVVVTAVALFLAAATVGVAMTRVGRSQAAFGDAEVFGVNRLGAATLDLQVGEGTALFEARNMAPGSRAVGRIDLVNGGTLPLRYSLTADTVGGDLAGWLRLDLWVGVECDAGATSIPAGAEVLVRAGSLTTGLAPLVGAGAVGAQPGDRVLTPGAAETLCLAVELPIGAPNEAMGLEMTQQITALAEHAVELSE